ncbi:MAG: hypothetical protein AABY40_01075 [Nanoarchaeota archaeon]
MDVIGSQTFGNILFLVSLIIALVIGWRQIYLNDVVELYAVTSVKQVRNVDSGTTQEFVIILIQNVGTRLVYLDKYIFNGSEYITNGQIFPSTYSQAGAGYWIDLPSNGIHHVSIAVHYHDLDNRYWESNVVADFVDNGWKTSSLPRKSAKR